MNIEVINKEKYDIYYVKSNKFKTILISTLFINKTKYENITKDKLLCDFLINSTKKYNNEVKMSRELMNLYDPRIDVYDIYLDMHSKCFDISFLDEKYTEKGMNKKTIDFYYDLIFNPNICNNSLEENNFDIVKNSLFADFSIREENPSEMAFINAMKNIKDDIPISHDTYGNKSDLNKINREECLKYYLDSITNSKVVIFIVGNIDDSVINYIDNNIKDRINKNNISYKKEYELSKVKDVLIKNDKSNFNETIIYLIYKINNMTKRERYGVLPLLNEILGGSSAKLFNNVREKNSLAYYAYSNYSPSQSLLYMYAGINKVNKDKTINLMKEQLESIKNNDITDEELISAKNTLLASLKSTDDNQYKIVNDMIFVKLFDRDNYKEREKIFLDITKEEIVNLSKKIDLDIIYTLEGEDRNE